MSEAVKPDTRDWKTRLFDWFLGLDLATKLLVYICFGIYFGISIGIPKMRSWMNEDLDKITNTHRDTMNAVIQSWDSHVDKTINAFKEDQDRDQKLLERILSEKHVATDDDALARP